MESLLEGFVSGDCCRMRCTLTTRRKSWGWTGFTSEHAQYCIDSGPLLYALLVHCIATANRFSYHVLTQQIIKPTTPRTRLRPITRRCGHGSRRVSPIEARLTLLLRHVRNRHTLLRGRRGLLHATQQTRESIAASRWLLYGSGTGAAQRRSHARAGRA